MNYSIIAIVAAICSAGVFSPVVSAAPEVTIRKNVVSSLPEIWKSVPVAQRLQYVRSAEMDATRILAERIMGISVDGETSVKELAAASDVVKGALSAALKGVKTVGKPTFHDDGRVEVIRSVKTRMLLESITKKVGSAKQITSHEVLTAEIDALGNAAIPGSDGHARVMAKRAAEMDVYRKLVERAAGVQITSNSTMRDFAVESDTIKATFANVVKCAKITAITYLDDNSAEVTATLKIGPLVRVVAKTVAADGSVNKVTESCKQMEIEETGTGAPPAAGEKVSATTTPTTSEIDLIISETLSAETAL